MKTSKILTVFAALAVALSTLVLPAGAVEPSYKVSEYYKDTLYYQNLRAVELTGDGATDTVAVALSQLGYHEGNKNADLNGLNSSGSKNFVEYNVLFGKLDNGEGNGVSYGYAWCAAFVNWCLRQARVDNELTGGMYVSCHSWRNWFVHEGAAYGASYHARTDDYIPKKGDLIFYKSLTATHNRSSDHIGIVLACEDGIVYTIEGNGDNRVALHEYALSNRYIVGYGSIAYKTADVPAVDHYANENHQPGFFVADKAKIAAYAYPDSSTGKVATLTAGGVYRITAVQGAYGSVVLEDGSTVWVLLKRFTPMTADPAYQVEIEAGEQSVRALVAQGASWQIPALTLDEQCLGLRAGEDGEIYMPGQSITPVSDIKLQAVYPQESESESATAPVTEAESASQSQQETTEETWQTEQGVDTEKESETQAAGGCNGVIGASVIGCLLAAGAVFVFGKKKS